MRQDQNRGGRREPSNQAPRPTRQNKVVRGRPPAQTQGRSQSQHSQSTRSSTQYQNRGATTTASRQPQSRRAPAKRKKSKTKKVLLIIGIVLVFLVVGGFLLFHYMFGTLKQTDLTKDLSALGITEDLSKQTGVYNIALFGVDSRESDDKGRSDAIMVATIDKTHGSIKITSLARDTYVSIDGHGKTKLNHAYSYGGAELAIKTINQNFGLDIKDYVTVNFEQLAKVIDAVGGIDVTISEEENVQINGLMDEVAPEEEKVDSVGEVHLNGNQAVAYSRIRHVAYGVDPSITGDDGRTKRQRDVLHKLFDKAKGMSIFQYPNLVRQGLSIVETSLDYGEIMNLSTIMLNKDVQLKELSFPNAQSNAGGKTIDGTWYYVYDLEVARQQLSDFIYNDVEIGADDTQTE